VKTMSDRVLYGITAGGSANNLLRGQLAWLRERGWEVHLAVNPDAQALLAAQREGVSLEPLPMIRTISLLADLRSLAAWVRILSKLRPGVVNVSTPKAGLLGGLAAWALRVPRRIYVLRGLRLEGASGPLASILWLMEWAAIAVATDVVVVSRSLGEEALRRRLVRPGRAWLVGDGSSNGVRADLVAAEVAATDADALRLALGLDPRDVVIGYVGRITADKGIETLLTAFTALPETLGARLLLIGSTEDEALAERLSTMGDRCVHVGYTEDVWRYYAIMDFLSLPTRREGFPNVVLEAAAAGVPTVTTRATGAVDSVVDGVTGVLVEVDDAKGLAEALGTLAADPALRRSLGEAARLRASEEYQPERIWSGIESIMRGSPVDHVHRV